MSSSLRGIAASRGIAFGKAYKLAEPELSFSKKQTAESSSEIKKLHHSLKKAQEDLARIRSKVHQEQGEANAQIFDAHLLLLEDPELIASIEEKITAEKINAEAALHDATSDFIELFEQMENEYMRE